MEPLQAFLQESLKELLHKSPEELAGAVGTSVTI